MSPLGPWRELPHLGVPDGEELLAHYLAEHAADIGFMGRGDGTLDGLVAFGGVDVCTPWPTDQELAAARDRIGERR